MPKCVWLQYTMHTLRIQCALPSLVALSCNRLDNPQNGRVDLSGTTVGSIATYTCTPGFQLNGQQTRQCLVSGSWSGQEPTCDG